MNLTQGSTVAVSGTVLVSGLSGQFMERHHTGFLTIFVCLDQGKKPRVPRAAAAQQDSAVEISSLQRSAIQSLPWAGEFCSAYPKYRSLMEQTEYRRLEHFLHPRQLISQISQDIKYSQPCSSCLSTPCTSSTLTSPFSLYFPSVQPFTAPAH